MRWRWFHQWGSPRWFYERAGRWQLVCGWLSVGLIAVGTIWGSALPRLTISRGTVIESSIFMYLSRSWLRLCTRRWP